MKWSENRNRLALRHFFDGKDHHARDRLIEENGVWGTCSGCPRDDQHRVQPQKCGFSDRYDHQIIPPEVEELAALFLKDPEFLELILKEMNHG